MTRAVVEVVLKALLKPLAVDVHEKGIAARLDARKRLRKKVRQRRPVEPALANRGRFEGEAQAEARLQFRVARIYLRGIKAVE